MMTFRERLVGAALLEPAVYEEVEADRSATLQAMAVVMLSSLAAGVGGLGPLGARPAALAGISLLAFAVWAVWALVTLEIGTRIFPAPRTQADFGQLLRTIGFASAPGHSARGGVDSRHDRRGLHRHGDLDADGDDLAVRQALDYTSTARAFAVCAFGWALAFGMALGIGIFWSPVLH